MDLEVHMEMELQLSVNSTAGSMLPTTAKCVQPKAMQLPHGHGQGGVARPRLQSPPMRPPAHAGAKAAGFTPLPMRTPLQVIRPTAGAGLAPLPDVPADDALVVPGVVSSDEEEENAIPERALVTPMAPADPPPRHLLLASLPPPPSPPPAPPFSPTPPWRCGDGSSAGSAAPSAGIVEHASPDDEDSDTGSDAKRSRHR